MKSHLTIVVKLHIIQSKKFIVHTKQSCIYWNECAVRIGLWNGFDTVCLNKNAELVFMRDGIECVWLAGEWKSMLGDKKMRNKANHIVTYRIVFKPDWCACDHDYCIANRASVTSGTSFHRMHSPPFNCMIFFIFSLQCDF